MRLSISNIAWDVADDEDICKLLRRYQVDAIDVAPGKYFSDFARTGAADIDQVRQWWAGQGIEITGMQALLYGTKGLNVFGPPDVQDALLRHLTEVCRIGSGLGATRLVFGSPKNRDRSGLSDAEALDVAVPFFRRLGDTAQSQGVLICLEPNPVQYGANFMTTSPETAHVVRAVDHPAIRMQLDAGAMTINRENPLTVLQDCADLIGHVHASEPDLLPLGTGKTDHGAAAQALVKHLPKHIVCIEMLAGKDEPALISIERALQTAVHHYRHQLAKGETS